MAKREAEVSNCVDAIQHSNSPTNNSLQAEANILVTSPEALRYWLANTEAEITSIGGRAINVLSSREELDTSVTYCSHRSGPICGGPCTTYNGGATCLNAPDTNCLWASNNVAFCDKSNCGGSCNQFDSCGTRLDGNYCYTPGTKSILVGTY